MNWKRKEKGVTLFIVKEGRRESMEDRYSAVLDFQGDSKQAVFGIFDGHGGAKAAEFAAQNLDKNILEEVMKRGEHEIRDAVKRGYLNTDSEFLKEDALLRPSHLITAPQGRMKGNRIETLGGYVDLCHGLWRVQGSLAVSRGIGDRHLKQWIIAEPETTIIRIKPEYEFLILASDGLWDKVSNQEAVDIARRFCRGIDVPAPMLACKKLVDLSVSRGSVDDISVMLIPLNRYI
ncbi:hypothetical protein Patl1_31073 [Pistacia atlantica]|uniref:Uncharacterized protein n=1 Tax=Pistacia atlantica TaxID=434234 RepID=A0ACC1AB34_9ROSI|nr:hypothetical protein Patl1_31073 [Pistacia atlantica]